MKLFTKAAMNALELSEKILFDGLNRGNIYFWMKPTTVLAVKSPVVLAISHPVIYSTTNITNLLTAVGVPLFHYY